MCIQNWSETQYFKVTLAVSRPHDRNVNTALRSCRPHDEFDPSVTYLPILMKNEYMLYIHFQTRIPGF